jgi:hypothetical protein
MRKPYLFAMLVTAALGLAAACSDSDSEGTELPATTGSAVWTFLQDVDYAEQWNLWPGKGELYEGGEPHGQLFTTYLNAAALEALTERTGSMPNGAIIVKENYTADSELDALTVMYKSDGFNDEHRDWFFAKLSASGAVQAEGRVEGCQACHGARADNDYILTSDLN